MAQEKKTTVRKRVSAVGTQQNDDLDEPQSVGKGRSCCALRCECGSGGSDIAGFAYFLGIAGAAVHYVSAAPTFWMGVLGILKALVWPAFLVYELMRLLGM